MQNKPIRALTKEERKFGRKHMEERKDKPSSRATICELIRDLWRMSNSPEAKAIAVDALCYAKRMNQELRKRDGSYDTGWWEPKSNRESVEDEVSVPDLSETID